MIRSIEELKNAVAQFSDETFGDHKPYTVPLHHMKEEVDECIVDGDVYEFADCLLLLLDAFRKRYPGASTNYLLIIAWEKLQINKMRKWSTEPDHNGVCKHIG